MPLFRYLRADGTAISNAAPLTLAERSAVAAVQVTVTVKNTGRAGSNPVAATTTVGMPNLTLNGNGL